MATGPTPPGHDGLLGTLKQMNERIDNGIRNAGPANVVCVTRLDSDVSVGLVVDTQPVTEWKSTAETDKRGMYHYNNAGDTYWTIPFKGAFRVLVHSRWDTWAGVFDPNNPPPVSTSILLNGTDPSTNGITEATAYNMNGAKCCYNAICEDRVFARGDKLRVNFWSRYGGTVKATSLAAYTHVVIRYIGPE